MNSSVIGKIEKAMRYAQERDRVTFLDFTVGFCGDNDNHILGYHEGHWHCNCDFFSGHGFCSHTMALQRILGEMLPQEAQNPSAPSPRPAAS